MVRYCELVENVDKKAIEFLVKKHFRVSASSNGDGPEINIDDEGLVSIIGTCWMSNKIVVNGMLPVKFREISDIFIVDIVGLKSLHGCPQKVGGSFSCSNNELESLAGCPSSVGGEFDCTENNLKSLDHLPRVKELHFTWTPDLPILKALTAETIVTSNPKVTAILNRHCNNPSRRSMIACQKELINAGFEGNALW